MIGFLLGAIVGYVYWMQVGCSSGTCAITASPWRSTLYGAMMGWLFLGIFKKEKSQPKDTQINLNNH